ESRETRAERIVIMPTTVWRWRENLQLFSAFRCFEQPQASATRIYFVIRNGVPRTAMPSWPMLSDRQIWDVVAYIHSLKRLWLLVAGPCIWQLSWPQQHSSINACIRRI